MIIKDEKYCRICKSEIKPVWDLGEIYVSSFLKEGEEGFKAPLVLAKCDKCGLIQLKHTVELDGMYKKYWYRSGLNASMVKDLKDIVTNIENVVTLKSNDIVVDIGTNDGTFLSLYKNNNLLRVGFDPATNLHDNAFNNCDIFINDYFEASYYPKELNKAKVITAIAMFYDLPDPNKFIQDVKKILRIDGVFVIQLTDWVSTIKNNMIDNFCHEHLEYYTLIDLINLITENGLEIFDISHNKVNGGSVRLFISFPRSYEINDRVVDEVIDELTFLSSPRNSIEEFKNNIEEAKLKINKFLFKNRYNNVYALGASTKGNTLLQLFDLDYKKIIAIGEINKDKFGLKTVGTNIPIIPENDVLDSNPQLIIILPWHFRETFIEKLKDYLRLGGAVLFPLPEPFVLTNTGGFYL